MNLHGPLRPKSSPRPKRALVARPRGDRNAPSSSHCAVASLGIADRTGNGRRVFQPAPPARPNSREGWQPVRVDAQRNSPAPRSGDTPGPTETWHQRHHSIHRGARWGCAAMACTRCSCRNRGACGPVYLFVHSHVEVRI